MAAAMVVDGPVRARGAEGQTPPTPRLSIIIPALDEAAALPAVLASLAPLRAAAVELIVVDGGSCDGTAQLAAERADHVLHAGPGRARQMNAGAEVARGDLLWFLHADTIVSAPACARLQAAAADPQVRWGRVGVRLDSRQPILRLTAVLMNLRSRWTGIATGDQGIFVRRALFAEVGGFPEQPLMEDVELCGRLRRRARPHCLPVGLTTSARRWQEHGSVRTILLMWRLRLAYWWGTPPVLLARRYQQGRGR